MLHKVFSAALRGVEGCMVLVELDLVNGLPGFVCLGLTETAARETRERVASAIRNSGFRFPSRKITVNLATSDVRRDVKHFDLPIALAVLSASGQLPVGAWSKDHCFVGELALDGSLRPIAGALPMALQAKVRGFKRIVIPAESAEGLPEGFPARGVRSLREVVALLGDAERPDEGAPPERRPARPTHSPRASGMGLLPEPHHQRSVKASHPGAAGAYHGPNALPNPLDIADVKGQTWAKRALEIAAAGGHNILFIGPPGVGKSMLAKRLITILPELTPGESLQVATIRSLVGAADSVSGALSRGLKREGRPFRSPHHSTTMVALIGGGGTPRPGEVTLAHGGVLFLDELGEFKKSALEALRQPLEDFKVTISRSRDVVEYPSRFMLVAATNPCPCGFRGHPRRECRCTPPEVVRYLSRLSGPLLDRIDIQVEMSALDFSQWLGSGRGHLPAENSATVRARVLKARERQSERLGSADFALNAYISPRDLPGHCRLDEAAVKVLEAASRRMGLSARSLDRALKTARTIADLAGSQDVGVTHLSEAVQMRSLDRLGAAAQ